MASLLRSLLLFVALSTAAHAICPVFPVHFTVGADAGSCSYNTIQAAIDAAGSCPVIIDITREHLYGSGGFCTANQSGGCHLSVDGKNVTLQGWGDGVSCYDLNTTVCAACGPGQTVPLVTLDGASAGGSVLSATSNNGATYVTLRNLTLTHGATAGSGGGISYGGHGSLTLEDSTVSLNAAANGGGIDVNGSGGAATLTLGANTIIVSNTAQSSGGGIRMEGNSRLFALQPQTLIGYNHAPNGYGGGVQVVGPASADIGSPGYGAGGVIFYNDAAYGGGLSLQATSDNFVHARLFAVDPAIPARISQNTASHTGGGIHLKPASGTVTSSGGAPALCAYGLRVDGNIAQEGTAIYGDTDYSAFYGNQASTIEFGRTDADTDSACAGNEPIATLGAVVCAPGAGCNQLDGNQAQDSSASPTPGATILLQNLGYLRSTALALRGNAGAHALRTFDSAVVLDNCLVADGSFTASVFQFENQGEIAGGPGTETLQNCTFANNATGGATVISSAYGLSLLDSIIDQPGVPTLSYTAAANQLDVEYVLSNDTSTLPGTGIAQGAPTFVDAAHGDYHLAITSLGVDYAPPVSGDDRDLDGLPHDQDLPSVANVYGDRDLGAYERQLPAVCDASNDAIFCSGFEQ